MYVHFSSRKRYPARAGGAQIGSRVYRRAGYRGRTRGDFAARDGADFAFDAEIRAFCARKYDSDFSREMSRSAAVYWQDFLPWHEG